MEVERSAAAGLDAGGLGGELHVERVAGDGCAAAGAPGLAVEGNQADLRGGLVAASATNEDEAVDEGKLVVFLKEDDEAVRRALCGAAATGLNACSGGMGILVHGSACAGAFAVDAGLGAAVCADETTVRATVRASAKEVVRNHVLLRSFALFGRECLGHCAPPEVAAAPRRRRFELNSRAGSVAVDEDFVGDAAYVRLGDFVEPDPIRGRVGANRRSGSGIRQAGGRGPGCQRGRAAGPRDRAS